MPVAPIQSVSRAATLLFLVAEAPHGLRPAELSATTGLNRQTVYNLVRSLEATALLRRSADGRCLLGLGAGSLATAFARQLAPAEHLSAYVRRLADATGESAYAVGWLDDEIIVLTAQRGSNPIQAAEVPVGFSTRAYARASGKLLLAFASEARFEAYLAAHPFSASTARAVTDRATFEAELAQIRARGFAAEQDEFAEGLSCLAVPVASSPDYALTVAGPSERFRGRFDTYLGTARQIGGGA